MWDGERVHHCEIMPNHKIRYFLFNEITKDKSHHVAIEMIASYGMAVGKTVFETVFWIGRFYDLCKRLRAESVDRVYRKDVKMYLCNSMRAKDSNIRQALIDRIGPIGKKNNPGPLYKIRGSGGKDIWAALSVAVTYENKLKRKDV